MKLQRIAMCCDFVFLLSLSVQFSFSLTTVIKSLVTSALLEFKKSAVLNVSNAKLLPCSIHMGLRYSF